MQDLGWNGFVDGRMDGRMDGCMLCFCAEKLSVYPMTNLSAIQTPFVTNTSLG